MFIETSKNRLRDGNTTRRVIIESIIARCKSFSWRFENPYTRRVCARNRFRLLLQPNMIGRYRAYLMLHFWQFR
jgi:hypothetical protein